jgi:hypothetical protein
MNDSAASIWLACRLSPCGSSRFVTRGRALSGTERGGVESSDRLARSLYEAFPAGLRAGDGTAGAEETHRVDATVLLRQYLRVAARHYARLGAPRPAPE